MFDNDSFPGGFELLREGTVPLACPRWKAEQLLREMILKESSGANLIQSLTPDDSLTFRWFVEERYIPMRQGKWSPACRETNTYQLKHYLTSQFGDLPLKALNTFGIQVWLNGMAEKEYSESVVRYCFTNVRAITHMAKKQKFLAEDPGEDLEMPQTRTSDKPVMTQEQIYHSSRHSGVFANRLVLHGFLGPMRTILATPIGNSTENDTIHAVTVRLTRSMRQQRCTS
jgi:hypothetical protein